MGLVNLTGAEWHSSRGGLIDRRIVLDLRLARREEGGPVLDAAGGCLGMSTFGPRGQVLAIPTATIERIVPVLLKDGRIARGWLGVALQAVAVPDGLRETADQSSGLMVMSVVEDGPAAHAGIVAGDIILSVDGHVDASIPKNRPAFWFRQHRAKGRSSPHQGRYGDHGADLDCRTARRMSIAANKLPQEGRLRVAIFAADSLRRAALSRLVVEAGHIVVGEQDMADVVLSDGDCAPGEARPVVTLGGANFELPGLLSRDASASQIDAALRGVAAGLIVRSPDATAASFGPMPESDVRALLTPRELEVLAAIADGHTNKAIARRLDISLHTVKFHVESVFRKLGARTRTEAVAKASERRRSEAITL